jgi:hypothetical protein
MSDDVVNKNQRRKPKFQNMPADLQMNDGDEERKCITAWEMFKIVSWKSAKGVAWLSLNSEKDIVSCTEETISRLRQWKGPQSIIGPNVDESDWDEWEVIVGDLIGADETRSETGVATGLLRLHGVGYPVATAVLAVLKPDLFPVMDKWGVQTIFDKSPRGKWWHNKRTYRAYAHRLANPECPELEGLDTLRDRDLAVMNSGLNRKPIAGYDPIDTP